MPINAVGQYTPSKLTQKNNAKLNKKKLNAGGFYSSPAQTSGTGIERPMENAVANNTYQRQSFAPTQVSNAYSPERKGLISALDSMRGDITNSLEGTLRQVASDKVFAQENSNIARNVAGSAYDRGLGDVNNAYNTAMNQNTRTRDDELSAMNAAKQSYESGFSMNEAQDALQREESNNKLKSLYAKLGTLAGTPFQEAAEKYNVFANIASAQRRGEQNATVADYLNKISNATGFYGNEGTRLSERRGEAGRDLSNTYQNNLSQIASEQDRADREAAVRNFQAENNAMAGQNEVGFNIAKYLQGFQTEDRDQSNLDRNFNFTKEQAGLDNQYRNLALSKEYDPNSIRNQLAIAGLTGQYDGQETLQARQARQQKLRDDNAYLADLTQRGIDNEQEDRRLDIAQGQADTAAGKGEFTPAQQQQAKVTLLRYLSSFAPAPGPQQYTGKPGVAQSVDPSKITAYINSFAPGNSLGAQKLRQELAALASSQLQKYGINAPIFATPQDTNANGVVGEYQQAVALGFIDPEQVSFDQYVKSKKAQVTNQFDFGAFDPEG